MNKPLIIDFLKEARSRLGEDQQVADFIVSDLLSIPLSQLPMYYKKEFCEISQARAWLDRFLAGEPYQYISQKAFFYDLDLYVDQRVLIPRPETEELVEWVLINNKSNHLKVLDIGTGSGNIAITLKKRRPDWQVTAVDISKDSLEVAKINAKNNQVAIDFEQSDLFKNIQNKKFDLIISNPPYIAKSEVSLMDDSVLNYEPKQALFAPDEGLFFYKKLASEVRRYLNLGGRLYLEFGFKQKKALSQIFSGGKLVFKSDLSGNDRMLVWQNDH